VPHRLIDIIELNETYSAARFVADAWRLIAEIRARGAWEFQTPTARPSRGTSRA
jgi:tRNA A37 N6-isopentenylltransferase MiaA